MNRAPPPPGQYMPGEARLYIPHVPNAVTVAVLALVAVGIFARIMNYPLQHDEEIHVAAGRMLFQEPLYTSLNYNHMPNLPLLLAGLYALTGTDHLLLAGRILIVASWIMTAGLFVLIARHFRQPFHLAGLAILLLTGNTLLGPAGMIVTNNFLPVPFALLGFYLFAVATDGPAPRPVFALLAGISLAFAIGLKVSYIFLAPPFAIAALLVPHGLSVWRRVRLVALPLLGGALIGGLPAILFLLDNPDSFLAHTLRYFTVAHKAYWQAITEPKVMAIAGKVMLAQDAWLAGSIVLCACLAGFFALTIVARDGARQLLWWPVALMVALMILGAGTAFVPTPSFPQYYVPPIPFLIVLMMLLHARLAPLDRAPAALLLVAVALLTLAAAAPRLMLDLPRLASPGKWTGLAMHREGERVRQALADAGLHGRIATLSPIIPLEGGLPIYPEFASGPFVYRVADLIPPADRRWYRMVSARDLPAFLAVTPPDGILVGAEGALDAGFQNYATAHGYRRVDMADPALNLFIRQQPVAAAALPTGR